MFQPFGVSDGDLWEPPKKNQVVELCVEMMENPTVCKGRVGFCSHLCADDSLPFGVIRSKDRGLILIEEI